jgi:flagellar biosynthesis protein FlhG
MRHDDTTAEQLAPTAHGPLRAIAVASGKGGVGKTTLAANLAVALTRHGRRVCVLDGDFALPNLHLVLGMPASTALAEVVRGSRHLVDAIADGPAGIGMVAGTPASADPPALDSAGQLCLLDEIDGLDGAFDTLLIDTASGIAPDVLFFGAAAAEALVVVTTEPTSIDDAYTLISLLARRYRRREFLVAVNLAAGPRHAEAAFNRLARLCGTGCAVHLEYLGFVPQDVALAQAVRARCPLALVAPAAPAARAIDVLAQRLAARPLPAPTGGLQFVYGKLLEERGQS